MKNFFLPALFILSVIGYSCRTTRKTQTIPPIVDSIAVPPPASPDKSREDSLLVIRDYSGSLRSNAIRYNSFSARADVEYRNGNKSYDVNANIRMVQDSVIWISITAILGLEGMRVLITKDSVKLLDKQNKIYTSRSLSFLQEMADLPLDLSSLQDLLVGNPVFLDSNIVSYRKTANAVTLLCTGSIFQNRLAVSETDRRMLSSILDDMDTLRNRNCVLLYDEYETKKGLPFSARRRISISEKEKLDIKIHYRQYSFNETLSFPFNVPKNYTRN